MLILFILTFSYLVGAIPTGYWFAKYCFCVDVTESGSGNIGATNVARVLGNKKYFFLIFFLDFLKAFFALFLIKKICNFSYLILPKDYFELWLKPSIFDILFYSSIFLLIGNAYSIFLKFKGGKGVATALGILAFLGPLKLFLMFLSCWGLILVISRRVDIASLISTYFITFVYLFFPDPQNFFLFLLFLCIWLTFRHKSNIKALIIKN